MSRISRHMVRMALVAMVFQFLSPAFIPVILQEIPTERVIAFHPQHTSIVAPTFLKEKDEKEDSDIGTPNASAVILDFTNHSFNLTVSHSDTYSQFAEEDAFLPLPRFALFCTLLI